MDPHFLTHPTLISVYHSSIHLLPTVFVLFVHEKYKSLQRQCESIDGHVKTVERSVAEQRHVKKHESH